MTKVERHEQAAGNGVARLRLALDHAHRRTAVRPVADFPRRNNELGRAHQRIATAFHRRRAGVAFHAGPVDLVPALTLRARDDADGLLLALQDRALLDMGLEEGADLAAADRLLAVVADLLQRLGKGHTVAVLDGERMIQREGAAEHARGDHGRREAAAFLVGPHRDLDRRLGDVVRIVQHAQHFQPCHHAIGAVELAAGRLGVEMRAGHHRRLRRIAAFAAGEDITQLVDFDGAACLLGPAHEEIAALAVEVGERDAADATLLGPADLAQFHQARPQPVVIDAEIRPEVRRGCESLHGELRMNRRSK